MKRVLITGSGGAGKTTFARALSTKINVEVIHLDYFFHQNTKKHTEHPEIWIKKVHKFLELDSWIMEGNYSLTYTERFVHADTFIFLDVSTWVTVKSIFKRRWQYRKKQRPEMPDSWVDRISIEFLRYVIRFKRDSRDKLLAEIEQYRHKDLDVHIFKSRKAAYEWLNSIEQ